LSQSLLPTEVLEAGNFMTITVEDMRPVPDEWQLKANEKDMNSSKYKR
jgi:hypothetical protein